jgi:CDGSH iron-sulfur domain-containing protein 3
MVDPVIAQPSPYGIDVEQGKTYAWCACGQSASQPFCDGSHKGGPFTPVIYKADRSGTLFFCGCKRTKNKPLCDGSHKSL